MFVRVTIDQKSYEISETFDWGNNRFVLGHGLILKSYSNTLPYLSF